MDIGKLQFKLADRCYFQLPRKCSLNITEAVKSRNFSFLLHWNAMEAFSLRPQDSSNNSPDCLLFCLSTNFLLNKASFFIDILQIIDRKLIFDTVFAPTTHTKG